MHSKLCVKFAQQNANCEATRFNLRSKEHRVVNYFFSTHYIRTSSVSTIYNNYSKYNKKKQK